MPATQPSTTTHAAFTAAVHSRGRVVLSGAFDRAGLDAFRAAVDQALLEPAELIRIDASRLSCIDSTAVSELLRYQLTAFAHRRQLRLERVSVPVAEELDRLELHYLFREPGHGSCREMSATSR